MKNPTLQADDAFRQQRTRELFDEHLRKLHAKIDRMFVVLMLVQWAFAVVCAAWLTPYAWEGTEQKIHEHVWLSVLMGGMLAAPAVYMGLRHPARRRTRNVIALCQMAFSALLIHVTGGRLETHFHIFGSLAFLAAYRDWTLLIPATLLVAAEHLVQGVFWPETIFGVSTPENWRWLEHAGWVLFEDLWLVICCRQGISEVMENARNRAELEANHHTLTHQAQALEESLRERQAIVEGALDAVIQIDSAGQIVGWNSQAEQVFGWSKSEVLGRPLPEIIIPVEARQAHCDGLERYRRTGVGRILNQRIEVNALRRDGSRFPIELAITPIRCDGRMTFCAFARDISERRHADERLRQAKEAAEAASHAKSVFLANMSHEIRTPLNAILGFTDLLRTHETISDAERLSHLEAVHRSGEHLLTIINDILDLSKIEAGQMRYERIPFSPHQVIVDVLSLMRVRAVEKGLSLDARWLGHVPQTILGDPARVRQVLLNLVGNAIKFTERGSVQIIARVDSSQQRLTLEVCDTGVGIAADKLDSIFAPFIQADVSVTRRFGGTGLGLSICRHLAQALGGDITVQSSEGRGSTFAVAFDTGSLGDVVWLESPPTEAVQSAPAIKTSRDCLAGLKVLVVDDGPTNRRLLEVLLSRVGAEVDLAEHGGDAVLQATTTHYDAILMDMQMPVLDGYSATRELRNREVKTPIIALTAHAMSGEDKKCYDAGCDGYLTKPVNRDELIAALSRLLAADHEVSSQVVPTAARSASDSDAIVSELDTNDAELREIVVDFIERLTTYRLQLREAWQQRDWESLREQGHSLKGTAAMVGFPTISAVGSTIECQAHECDAELATSLDRLDALAARVRIVEGASR
jgi:PAS domain S-box-containing protein